MRVKRVLSDAQKASLEKAHAAVRAKAAAKRAESETNFNATAEAVHNFLTKDGEPAPATA